MTPTRFSLVVAFLLAASHVAIAAPALVKVDTSQFTDRPIPRFMVDAAWPTVPQDLMIGQVPGLSVDSDDNVWILQRPNSLGFSDTGLAQDPPIAICCKPAPHVMQFSSEGELLRAWGGPSHAPTIDGTNQWPANVHGLYVGGNDSVWIAGNGDGDHVALSFTKDGEYLRMVGLRNASKGNFDKSTLGGPADIAPVPGRDEILIADGYINKRIIGFDNEGRFTRYWGAYGASPDGSTRKGAFDQSQASSNTDGGANPKSDTFGDIVHCVVRGPDARIYVCDRRNNRVQIFETDDDGTTNFLRDIVIEKTTGGTRTASDIAFSPDAKFMYIADMMNGQVWIYDAGTYELLGAMGRNGRYPGQFIWLHSVDVDSAGNVYTTEVSTGRRVQKFVFQGVK
ncbi:beta-propeller fold lactonase family protein [Congregibacter brevis]|uniref:Beta-propeller fold lactonase family protein n=1 Tax=Congregibacter brevis TaxID=3081201 RepID=A0ABZ0IF07_9GAMM|nr:beta-propeller fold lactonase family protein [Congregibacter sp. IMCC45268]